MAYNSYAEFFLDHPEAMDKLKEVFGSRAYSDDNFICNPDVPEGEMQAVASVCLYGNELHVQPFDEDTSDFTITLN